jgi:hypothetical protein
VQVEVSNIVEGGEQAGDRDVAVVAEAQTEAVVDNVVEGGAPSSAVKEPSNAAESSTKTSGSESSRSDRSSTSSSSEELSHNYVSNGSSASGSAVDASTDGPVVSVSNAAVVSTAEVIVAVAAATTTATLSSMKSSYQTLGDEVLAKELGWLPASLVQPSDEKT